MTRLFVDPDDEAPQENSALDVVGRSDRKMRLDRHAAEAAPRMEDWWARYVCGGCGREGSGREVDEPVVAFTPLRDWVLRTADGYLCPDCCAAPGHRVGRGAALHRWDALARPDDDVIPV